MGFFNFFEKGIDHLKHTSFKEALQKSQSRDIAIQRAAGVKDPQVTTQGEKIEGVSRRVEEGTKNLAENRFVKHIPIFGSAIGEIHSYASDVRAGTEALNNAIDAQDAAAKRQNASIHHYRNIFKTASGVAKVPKKHFKEVESLRTHIDRADRAGDTTQHRYDEAVTM